MPSPVHFLKRERRCLLGKLRIEPKHQKPGFLKFQINPDGSWPAPEESASGPGRFGSTITLVTRQGTTIHISRDLSLEQVARLTRMLDASWPHDLG